jgi:hypothetical protein
MSGGEVACMERAVEDVEDVEDEAPQGGGKPSEPLWTVAEILLAASCQGAATATEQVPPTRPTVAAPAASREARGCFPAKWLAVS